MKEYNLKRFHSAQENNYQTALSEIKNGKKISHWMWFIFPQIAGLGYSEISKLYAIADLEEAELYLENSILGPRLISISQALIAIKGKSAYEILGSPDDLKLKSCMTLFSSAKNTQPVFQQVLDRYFESEKDAHTLQLIEMIL